MCGPRFFLSTLLFLLAHGPHVTLLQTPASNTMASKAPSDSWVTSAEHSALFSSTEPTDEAMTGTERQPAESTAMQVANSTTESSEEDSSHTIFSEGRNVTATESEPAIITSEENDTTKESDTVGPTMMPTTSPELVTVQTTEATAPPDPEATTERQFTDTTATMLETSTASFPALPSTIPTTAGMTTSDTETIPTPLSETMEATPSTTATTKSTETFTTPGPGPHIPDSSTVETQSSTLTPSIEDTTSEKTVISVSIKSSEIGGENDEKPSSSKQLLLIILIVVIACLLTTFCIIILVRHRRKNKSQNFGHGYMNGQKQRSKKKKGEDDAWAGPVNLEGGPKAECEDPEEGGQGDGQIEETDAVLSTFVAVESNGGVGRPGSTEVQKWEEQEPLLYIDEDMKREEKQKERVEKANEEEGQKEEDTDGKTAVTELNGGESFCLTTAV